MPCLVELLFYIKVGFEGVKHVFVMWKQGWAYTLAGPEFHCTIDHCCRTVLVSPYKSRNYFITFYMIIYKFSGL